MKKWYKEPYFDRKAWIMENCDKLNLSSSEILLILFAEYARENRISLSYEYLTKKLNLSTEELDKVIVSLVDRHYLKLSTNSRSIVFDIDELFEYDPNKFEIAENKDLYDTLGDVFGRPLTTMELQKCNDLVGEFSESKLLEAVRIAEAQRKVKIAYIEAVLRNNEKQRQ